MTHTSPLSIIVLTRWLAVLIASFVVSIQLSGCGRSTDTGNPPAVDGQKIDVTASGAGVQVTGGPGAVPGGADVQVDNTATGDSATTTARSDGSFEVTLGGSPNDPYRVTVTSGGQSTTVTVGPVDLSQALRDRTFLLQSADGYTPVAGTTIQVSFKNGDFGFSAGCNAYGGPYTLCDGKLCLQGLGSTEIGCSADLSAQDAWLDQFFSGSPSIELQGDQLTFTSADATLVFLDREVANPDRPLTGRVWTVDTFINGDAASSLPAGTTAPTLEFKDDGTLDVSAGCNDAVYDYQVSGQEITLSLVTSTRNACTGAAADVGAQVSQVLIGMVTFQIDAQRLTLVNGSVGLAATTP